jgi:hypothetical protein
MNYDEFRAAWNEALLASRLPAAMRASETMCLRSMDREYKVVVEPFGGQDAAPFHVTAKMSWTWDALITARSRSIEEDTLVELLGREGAEGIDTVAPWLRVDVILRASAPYDRPVPMPKPSAWAAWVKETTGRLERSEPLLPPEPLRETDEGLFEVLGWKGDPEVTCHCGPGGELGLKEVELAAFVTMTLPRQWDDPDREPDDPPADQLAEFFGRVKASLFAWMQALDHLRPKQ